MSTARDIDEAAIAWRLRQEADGWSGADQAGLEAWLDETTAHRVAWLRAGHGLERAGRLASLKSPPAPVPARRRAVRWRPAALAAGLALALTLGALVVTFEIGRPGQAYATEIGHRETVALKDGSRVELNTASKVRADVGPDHRTVWLEKGEAYFEVAHDPAHPFVVYAGDRKIVVVGTKFSVRRDGRRVQVAVSEGKVRVELARPAPATPPAVVTGGDLAVAEATSTLVTTRAPERVAGELAWREGRLVFQNSALIEAAAEFNRYNKRKLVVEDAQAAGTMINGSFEAQNVEAFARLLRRAMRLNVDETGDEIRISS